MSNLNFPIWFGVGSYGGLLCSSLAAAGIALYALARRRGTPRQLARTILACLVASCLMLFSVWWNQNRLDLYGPSLAESEVTFWLMWTALAGWFVPLSALIGYLALAAPQVSLSPVSSGLGQARWGGAANEAFIEPDDPARQIEPLGAGRPWGLLAPLDADGGQSIAQPLPLTRKMILLGRELDNDIVTDDERTSRHHAELHWDHGHVHLRDRSSMNGTRINRQVVRGMTPLKSGDVIEVGAQRYQIELLPIEIGANAQDSTDANDSAKADQVETRKMPGAAREEPEQETALALVALNGPLAGQRWLLNAPLVSIGRDSERDICLPDESVSRLHAQIVRQRAGYFISDLHSRNGATLNGQPLTAPTLLMAGDVVRLGEIELRCDNATQDAPHLAQATEAPPTMPLSRDVPNMVVALAEPASPREDGVLMMARLASPRDRDCDHERPRLGPPRLLASEPQAADDEPAPDQ